ncbi:3-oxoacyl-[acyl-carrier-protein] synthase 2 [Planctomycetes bacterium Pan216]|uniref:3-oxoacyl-[acyl-carrier-protein] synthase 2 n=1 Tax=Kolteria novifilia TaxID=2527975 RepID=A0A518B9X5_9BACT|nr:3-oxoacyl-[acyl-carrier-protein] synthase 2 [Planctomycetes bacterium Pan216]
MKAKRHRVMVTGIGIISPLGRTRDATWRGLRDGAGAVRRVDHELADGTYTTLGAPVEALSVPEPVPVGALVEGQADRLPIARRSAGANEDLSGEAPMGWAGESGDQPDRLQMLAMTAADEAMGDAGLSRRSLPDDRFGCSIGNSKGSLEAVGAALDGMRETGYVDPRLWFSFMPDAPAVRLAQRFNLGGPSHCMVAACATGLLSVIQGASWIAEGRCDRVLAGSADASLLPMLLGSYRRLGVLAPVDGGDPNRAVRPFAANRQGFAVGEGAAMFVLESEESCAERQARARVELAGWSACSDPSEMVQLGDSPGVLTECIRETLDDAGLAPEQVGHINCHGTATAANDPWETAGIRGAFGDHADELRLTATKAAIGHLLGAAGSVELAATALALEHQFVPPTLNLDRPDPECDLDYTPHVGTARPMRAALKASIGFGGHIAAAVLRRCDGSS